AMARVEHRDAAGEVDVALAFDVPHLGVLGALADDVVGLAEARGHGGAAARHQGGVVQVGFTLHGNSGRSRGERVAGKVRCGGCLDIAGPGASTLVPVYRYSHVQLTYPA